MAHCRSTPHFTADNGLVQCLKSSVCPCRVPLHGPVQFEIIRGIRLAGHVFPKNCPFPFRNRHPHVTHCSSGHPKRHLDRFSRFCMGLKCYAVQCIVNKEEILRNCPLPLGFRHPAEWGPSHGHRQHATKTFSKDRPCGSDRQTHTDMHTDVLITILRNCIINRFCANGTTKTESRSCYFYVQN